MPNINDTNAELKESVDSKEIHTPTNNIITTININLLKKMFLSGTKELASHYQFIDELNVFPVPDGDTGTNMKITFEGASQTIEKEEYHDLFSLGKQFSRGLLMNARGNSGVISSQIFKGFVFDFKEGQTEITIDQFVDAFLNAKRVAYNAVSTPVEGTILTIVRVISEQLDLNRANFKSINAVFEMALAVGEETLARTPDMLPELKEVGVVDSGGYGICKFLLGMYAAFDIKDEKEIAKKNVADKSIARKSFIPGYNDNNEGFGYCNEFIMTIGSKVEYNQPNKTPFNFNEFKATLEKMGDSLVTVVDENLVKVHIHSTKPYEILQYAANFGEFDKIKIENMTQQFLSRNPGTTLELIHNKNKSTTNNFENLTTDQFIIATVPSAKFVDIYKQKFNIENTINTDALGNPSIQNFMDEIKKTCSSQIFIIVDDNNYVLAANETIKLLPKHVNVKLINAKDIATSYNICLAFIPSNDYNDNFKVFNKVINKAKVVRISRSVKDVSYSHIKILKNEYIGVIDRKIVSSSKNIVEAAKKLFENINTKKLSKATIFYGKTMVASDAQEIAKVLKESYLIESEIINGGQSVYYFVIGLD
ncbi:MAG: DAK2 domain-containing protein [Mycoplasmataceae bacterium]|jgi:DAK2 domain fusion protein YloV|nr:DAK2 domain-containing protein [Mycoplasmataceae bacterium]